LIDWSGPNAGEPGKQEDLRRQEEGAGAGAQSLAWLDALADRPGTTTLKIHKLKTGK